MKTLGNDIIGFKWYNFNSQKSDWFRGSLYPINEEDCRCQERKVGKEYWVWKSQDVKGSPLLYPLINEIKSCWTITLHWKLLSMKYLYNCDSFPAIMKDASNLRRVSFKHYRKRDI